MEVAGERDPASPILAQVLELDGVESHVQLAVRARAPGGAVIRARIRAADGAFVESAAAVAGAWADCMLRLALPSPGTCSNPTLEIALAECPFRRIDFARIDIVRTDGIDGAPPAEAPSRSAGADSGPWTRGAVERRSETFDHLVFEDPVIAAQLGRLEGLESWSSPAPLSASKTAPAAPSRPLACGPGLAAVDIVIPVHNALQEVELCLEALERRTGRPHRLILVNDRSDLATSEFLRAYAAGRPRILLIENRENLGYTRSANIGLRACDAEWVVLLNSDTVVSDNWLDGMLECAAADAQTILVGPVSNAATWQSVPQIRNAQGGWMVNPLPPGMSVDEVATLVRESSARRFPEVPLLNGFCTLMRRDVIAAVGFLDESAFPVGYGEENDLCIRVKKAGFGIRIADHVYVYHKKSASFGASRRLSLAASGRTACDAKHPDVPLDSLHSAMADCEPLSELRKRLKAALDLRLSQTP